MPDVVAIAGGTVLLYKVAGATGTAKVLNEAETVGDVSIEYAEINATPLNSKNIRYVSGLGDGQNVEITFFSIPSDTSQTELKQAWRDRKFVEFTLQPPKAESSTQLRFTLTPNMNGWHNGTGSDVRKNMLRGRITGDVIEESNAAT